MRKNTQKCAKIRKHAQNIVKIRKTAQNMHKYVKMRKKIAKMYKHAQNKHKKPSICLKKALRWTQNRNLKPCAFQKRPQLEMNAIRNERN